MAKPKKYLALLGYNSNYETISGQENTRCKVELVCNISDDGTFDTQTEPPLPIEIELRFSQYTPESYINENGKIVVISLQDNAEITNAHKNTYTYSCFFNYNAYSNPYKLTKLDYLPCYELIKIDMSFEKFVMEQKAYQTINRPMCNKVFVQTNDRRIIGILSFEFKDNVTVFKSTEDIEINTAKEYDYDSVTANAQQIYIDNIEHLLISKIDLLTHGIDNCIDWASNEDIKNMLMKIIKNSKVIGETKNKKKEIIEAINEYGSSNNITLWEKRKVRMENLFESIDAIDNILPAIINHAFSNPDFLDKSIEELVKNHWTIIENSVTYKNSIEEKEIELQKAIEENKKSEKNASLTGEQSLEFEKIKKEYQELKEKSDLNIEIKKLENEKLRWEAQIDLLKAQEAAAKIETDRAKENTNKANRQYKDIKDKYENLTTKDVIEKKLDMEILETVFKKSDNTVVPLKPVKFDMQESIETEEIVSQVHDYISNKVGRYILRNDVVNLLVCLTQGFITTIAGEPGTGKTSLCGILGKALGLFETNQYKRFAEISVERGWTSSKDFIGYYNPLTQSIVKSNKDMFNALQIVDLESGMESPPYIILLDEANLSPLEHYWANFMRLTDEDNNRERSIVLDEKLVFKIPKHLRFLATVNFDHTTEAFSPRFLDRSWIIYLKQATNLSFPDENEVGNNDVIYSFDCLQRNFTIPSQTTDLLPAIVSRLIEIRKIYRDNNIPLSPRTNKMVENYCKVAQSIMDKDTEASYYVSLDYAVSQKMIPMINGHGKKYGKFIDDLNNICFNMPLTLEHLKRIKNSAEENMDYYQFFNH